MDELLKIFLPAYILVFFLIVYLFRVIIVRKRIGKDPTALYDQQGVQGIIAFYFKVLPFLTLTAVMMFAFFPESYVMLGPLPIFQFDLMTIVGMLCLLISLMWIWLAQANMGKSWRIGIDYHEKTQLQLKGLFALSRNPIFLGMKVNLFGFFLTLPNALSLTILITGAALIDIQVALEEEYLEKKHGKAYKDYKSKVRRWL